LAFAAVERMAGAFRDGTAVVLLAGVSEPELVGANILSALGLRADPARPVFEQLAIELAQRQLLILVDNFEQLVDAAVRLSALLGSAPGLKLLVTSRVLLRLGGEHELRVGPLAQIDAVRLFVLRAQAANARFRLSDAITSDVQAVCERLERVPLALELAAARVRALSPGELLVRLDQRLAILTGGPQDAPERHQTLRATLDWSYELLPPAARELFAELSVFREGFTLSACQTICAADGQSEAELLDTLTVLVDHSLLYRYTDGEHPDRDGRFWMLEVVREYAAERLAASGRESHVSLRHVEYYLGLTEQANQGLAGPEQSSWFARLNAEIANIRAALAWALPRNRPELGLRLAAELTRRFWNLAGSRREDARWLELAIASAPQPSKDRAEALAGLAILTWKWSLDEAEDYAAQAVTLARELGDQRLLAWCTFVRGAAADHRGDSSLVETSYREAAALACAVGDHEIAWAALNNAANRALGAGDYERAQELARQALTIPTPFKAVTLCVLAVANTFLGRDNEAISSIREAAEVVQAAEALAVGVLLAGGVVVTRVGNAERAARLLGAEEFLRETRHNNHRDPPEQRMLAETLQMLRKKLYPDVLASAWQHGRSMSLQAALDEISKD
jgi:predicted ATPase